MGRPRLDCANENGNDSVDWLLRNEPEGSHDMRRHSDTFRDSDWTRLWSRRKLLATSASFLGGLTLTSFLRLREVSAKTPGGSFGRAKSCILIYCWGGMSHHE